MNGQGNPGTSVVRVGLTLGGIVLAAVVIFGLGVMEGSRVAERIPLVADSPIAPPTGTLVTQPAPAVTRAAPPLPDKLTFYDRLSGVAPAASVALPEGPPPAQGLAPASLPAAPGLPARSPETKAPPATAVAAGRKTAAPAPAAARAATTERPSHPDPVAQIRALTGKGRYTVQMAAVSERSAAAETAALINSNGFEAITVMASVKGKIWYRIRVGSFPDKQAATKAAGIFSSAFGLKAIPVEN